MLQRIFGAAALLIGLRMVFQRGADGGRLNLPGRVGLTVTGTGIGGLSALIGIGGGSLTVPWLSACRVPMVRAVGTSAACGLPIALAGVAGFVLTGWHEPGRMPHSIGYVLWPAVIGITVASMLAAPAGSHGGRCAPAGAAGMLATVMPITACHRNEPMLCVTAPGSCQRWPLLPPSAYCREGRVCVRRCRTVTPQPHSL